MGNTIKLLYCNFCQKPVGQKAVKNFGWFNLPLCPKCYARFLATARGR
ncbi:hypothetical protein KKC1_21970 [Calderihabitans maritimus]|uniref:Uncharacterized protein n=1 Tax=Calderihabitans maritimus TaxID=1246530 RepID=A0A1Z5HU44_9FIRM|nr:hypothetical protein KKC1_21970 [Calderihabitans maritimus]